MVSVDIKLLIEAFASGDGQVQDHQRSGSDHGHVQHRAGAI